MNDDQQAASAIAAPIKGIQARARAYAGETRAARVLVLDTGGHVVCDEGTQSVGASQDGVALGALLAGVFSSARQLGRLCDEDDIRTLFQQGAQRGVLTMLIGERWLLVTIFDRHAHVGLVRMLAAQLADTLAGELAALDASDLDAARATLHSAAFRASFDDTLDRLFHDDSIDEG